MSRQDAEDNQLALLTCESDLLAAGDATIFLLFGIFVTVLVVVLIAGTSTVGTFVWK